MTEENLSIVLNTGHMNKLSPELRAKITPDVQRSTVEDLFNNDPDEAIELTGVIADQVAQIGPHQPLEFLAITDDAQEKEGYVEQARTLLGAADKALAFLNQVLTVILDKRSSLSAPQEENLQRNLVMIEKKANQTRTSMEKARKALLAWDEGKR
jgi:septal ring factor EnvC (AmiA/AmiB activator)